jgi:hypothetical protein
VLEAVLHRAELRATRRHVLDRGVDVSRLLDTEMPETAVDRVNAVVAIVSPVLAPTWNVLAVPVSSLLPLNSVCVPMAVISVVSAVISEEMAALSSVFRVPPSCCTFSSRMRPSIECTSERAPSAVWTSEMPSWALRCDCARPPICARIFSLMARPAASSAARLMRYPEDSFSIALAALPAVAVRLRCELNASTLF